MEENILTAMNDVRITNPVNERNLVLRPPEEFTGGANVNTLNKYTKIYQRSIDDPKEFWGELANQLYWYKKWDKVLVEDLEKGKHEWFAGVNLMSPITA